MALKFGSCATDVCEPCQVGNKAALSRMFRVPQGCLAELTVKVTRRGLCSTSDARSLIKNEKPGGLLPGAGASGYFLGME